MLNFISTKEKKREYSRQYYWRIKTKAMQSSRANSSRGNKSSNIRGSCQRSRTTT